MSNDNKTFEEMTPDEFSGIIDRSAGGPGYRKIINLLVAVLILLGAVVGLEGWSAHRVAQEAERNSAAATVEIIEHRIRSEQGRECILNYLAALVGAKDEAAAQRVRRCPPEKLEELNAALIEAKNELRAVDPENPLLRFDPVVVEVSPPLTTPPTTPPTIP